MVIYGKCNGEILPMQSINYISHEYINQIYSHRFSLREDFKKKNSKKSDFVTIRSGTYLPYLNSDIKISDICSETLYLPTPRK